MNISAFVAALRANNTLMVIAQDPTAQFGTERRRYIGAELMIVVGKLAMGAICGLTVLRDPLR